MKVYITYKNGRCTYIPYVDTLQYQNNDIVIMCFKAKVPIVRNLKFIHALLVEY